MDFRFLLTFNRKSLEMFWILLIFSYLLSFGLTNELSTEDLLRDRLQSAAIDVISLHSHSSINSKEDMFSQTAEESRIMGQTLDRRALPPMNPIPPADNCTNLLYSLIPDPQIMRQQKINEMINNLKSRFVFHQTYLQKISDALKFAIRPNGQQLIVSPHLIRNLTVLNGVSVNQIKSLTNIFWENSKLKVNDLKFKLKDLINSLNLIEQRIATVIQTTSDVVLKNKPSVITGHKVFIGRNEITWLNTSSVIIGSVGRQDIRQVMNGLYRKRRPQLIRGVKHLMRHTFVKQSLNSLLINGIDLNRQIVTTNSPQIIKSLIQFESQLSVVNNLTIRGKLNNIDLNRDLVFLNRPEVVPTPKSFTSPLIIAQRINTGTIDGIDLRQLSENVLMANGLQKVNSKLIFQKPLTTGHIKVDGMVNNIVISMMATQLVYKNRPALIRGKKTFILDDLHIKNNLFVGHKIDGLVLTNDLLLNGRNQIITAPKVFTGSLIFEDRVNVNGFIDGLRLPQDIITLTGNETIIGPVVFTHSLIAEEDIDARRLVDGVDLSELQLYSLQINDRLIQSDVHFKAPVSVGQIQLRGLVNRMNLTALFNEAIFKGVPNVQISGTKTFESHVQIKQLFSDRVNGIDLNDLVDTHKNETIFVPKVFNSLTQFNSLDVNGFVSGVNVTDIYRNRISLSKPDKIFGTKNFINELIVEDGLTVFSINGFVPQIDFVLKSKPQIINGHKIFVKPLNANKVIAHNPTSVKGRINGIFLNDLNSRAIRLNSQLTTPLNIVLVNSNSSFVEVFKDINGLNITQFANNVMSLTKPQIVSAPKHFANIQTFSTVQTLKGISGISLKYLKENAILLNGISQISAPLTFTHPVVFERPLVVGGVVNGVNLTYLAIDSVYKTGHQVITGKNVFKSGFQVNGNIHSQTFNGIDLSNELWTKTRDHIIRGRVRFGKNLNVNGNIVLNGRINGLDLSEFNRKIMKTNDRNVINGNLKLNGPTSVLTNLHVSGKLNGINLAQLFTDAVFKSSNQGITGSKTLTNRIHLFSHLNSTILNDIDVKRFLTDVVYIHSVNEQHIFAPKVFNNDVISNGFIQSKGIAIMGPINGVNLIQLDLDSIKTNLPTNLKLLRNFIDLSIITNPFTQVLGRINGIDLNKDVVLTNNNDKQGQSQLITGIKRFEHIVINDNLLVDGLVNGHSLKAIEMTTFYTTTDQKIAGHKSVNGLLEFSADNNFVGTLNGLRIPIDFVTLHTNQTISGPLVFNNSLSANNIYVTGYVSGHNLTKLATESLLKNRPQVISQPIKFDSIVFRRDVTVDQHVDNVDLSALSNTVKQFTSVVNISKEILEVKASRHHYISDYLYKSLEKSLFEIQSFSLYQNLNEIHGNDIQVLSNDHFLLSEAIESPKTVHSVNFNPNTGLFVSSLVKKNPLIIVKSFMLSDQQFFVEFSPYSSNISAQITKSNQLMATFGFPINSIEILKLSESQAILISFQSYTGKLMVHSFESLPNKKITFTQITESLVGTDTSKVIGFLDSKQVFIVVSKQFGLNCMTDISGTLIFILRNYRTLELIQKLPVINVLDVRHFEANDKHYLALSDGTPTDLSLTPQTIHIYRTDFLKRKCSFSLFQKLQFDNTIQLNAFTYGTIHSPQQYLVAINSSHVSIWKQKGESGFTENWLLRTESARVVSPILADNNLFLIIGQRYKCHESLIFKGQPTGIALAPIVFKTEYN